jgi:Protein of unknown function (DUF1631)
MGTGDKATSFGLQNVSSATPRARQQKILQACKQNADQYIEGLIKQALDKLDEALINRSTKGADEPDSDAYAEAERELRSKRQEIHSMYSNGFTQNYNARLSRIGPAASSSKKGGGQAGGLSLVDEQELEESLAVDGLVARARDRLRNELYALAQRFNVLIDGAHYDDESQPFDPEVFSHAFRDVIQKMELRVEIKLIAYKLFEQSVMQTLGQFYHQINSLLSDAGVLPELKLSIPLRAVGGAHQARTTNNQGTSNVHGNPASGAQGRIQGETRGDGHGGSSASADVYQTLQKLMNARKYGDAAGDGAIEGAVGGGNGGEGVAGPAAEAAGAAALPPDDLVRGLSLLQHETLPLTSGGVVNVAVIKDALLGQMKQLGDGRGIHPAHDNTIDVIGMIFEFILDEPSIPDVVKGLLNQLQIPILKIAIVDKEFFTNKNHPARRLLNVLGHASIGWNDNDEAARQRRFEKMEYIVNRVLAEFEQDPGIFAGLLGEFIEFLAKDGGDVEVEQGSPLSDQLQQAHPDRLAFEAVEARLEGAEVPGVLRDFLRNNWRDVLQHVLDHEGRDSEAWRQHERMVDELMWSVEPKTTADERRKMVMLLPRLLDALREGMTLIGCSQRQIDTLIDALEPIHMAGLRGEKYFIEAANPSPANCVGDAGETSFDEGSDMIRPLQDGLKGNDESMAVDKQVSSSTEMSDFEKELLGMDTSFAQEDPGYLDPEPVEIEDEFTAMAAQMTLGTWLEFELGDKKRRGKLAWKSVVMGEYVFVDRKYKVVAERTLAGLAGDLRHGKASLVEDVPMFDRALDKVLNGLMSGSRTTH